MSTARIVNPMELKGEDTAILVNLLAMFPNSPLIKQGEYIVPAPQQPAEKIMIQLQYDLLKRFCVSNKHAGQHRYEILDQENKDHQLGVGGDETIVFASLGTLVPENNSLRYKSPAEKSRAVKRIVYTSDKQTEISDEFKLSTQAGHLHIKPAVFVRNRDESTCYFVMHRLAGICMADLIDKIYYSKEITPTTDQLIALSLAVLRAVKTQVHDKGLVHRDIKTENMLVVLDQNAACVNIIDFALSKKNETDDENEQNGTYGYMAPECILTKGTTVKSDIFSLSLVLGYLFGALAFEPHNRLSVTEIDQYEFPQLFEDCHDWPNFDLSATHQDVIRVFLTRMHDSDPSKRPTCEEVITIFEKIQTKRQEFAEVKSDTPMLTQSSLQPFTIFKKLDITSESISTATHKPKI